MTRTPSWRDVFQLFDEALEVPPEKRLAWLRAQAKGNPALFDAVAQLLEADAATEDFLEIPAAERAAPLIADSPPQQRFGAFDAVELIGAGGMGVVYKAVRRTGGFEQTAAVKCLRSRFETNTARNRFLTERQILARLQHPTIAHLLDGGFTDDGHPFLVMEYVAGTPIVEYCTAHQLDTKARIRLFQQVCEGVAHAHAQLIVHSDIKPTNILVSEPAGGAAKVTLLDFGIAHVLQEAATEEEQGHRYATPGYTAPEHLRAEPVTTAVDIFALGVLLGDVLATAKAHPDLAAIVARAQAAAPDDRYPSVTALADDLNRHLNDLPVTAHPPHVLYRLRKFLRRYRWPVAALTSILILLTSLTLVSQRSAAEIERALHAARVETSKAQEIATFLQNLFRSADPFVHTNAQPSINDLLRRGSERIDRLKSQPDTQRALLLELAWVRTHLGQFVDARALLDRALAIKRTSPTNDAIADIARTLHLSSIVHDELGQFDLAEHDAREALSLRKSALPDDDPDIGESLDRLASLLGHSGRGSEAIAISQSAVDLLKRVAGPDDARTQTAMHNLAWMLSRAGAYEDAESVHNEVISTATRTHGVNHPETLQTRNNFAVMLRRMGDYVRAEAEFRAVLEGRVQTLGEAHPSVGYSRNNLAKLLLERDRPVEAKLLLEQTLAVFEGEFGAEHANVAVVAANLAQAERMLGDLQRAHQLARRALDLHLRFSPEGSGALESARLALAAVLVEEGRPTEAIRLLEDATKTALARLGADHWQLAHIRYWLGRAFIDDGQFTRGHRLVTEAAPILARRFGSTRLVRDAREIASAD